MLNGGVALKLALELLVGTMVDVEGHGGLVIKLQTGPRAFDEYPWDQRAQALRAERGYGYAHYLGGSLASDDREEWSVGKYAGTHIAHEMSRSVVDAAAVSSSDGAC